MQSSDGRLLICPHWRRLLAFPKCGEEVSHVGDGSRIQIQDLFLRLKGENLFFEWQAIRRWAPLQVYDCGWQGLRGRL